MGKQLLPPGLEDVLVSALSIRASASYQNKFIGTVLYLLVSAVFLINLVEENLVGYCFHPIWQGDCKGIANPHPTQSGSDYYL